MKKNNKKGFTLVELVIVVAVMAVLVAVAIPTVKSIVGTAEQNVAKQNAKTIESMLKLEEAEMVSETGSTATLTPARAQSALSDAKLGIEGASFTYDTTTGVVAVAAEGAAGSATVFLITYADDGAVTVAGAAS